MAQAEEYTRKLKEAGIEVIDVTPDDINILAASAREKCWPVLSEKIDSQWINKALKSIVESFSDIDRNVPHHLDGTLRNWSWHDKQCG